MSMNNPFQGKKILLVEDDFFIAFKEKKDLENFGYIVKHVGSGEEAVELACSDDQNFNLILMDIDLGRGIDGTEAASRILKIISIPIVFLSSHTESEIVAKTEKITSYGYVVKDSGITILDASIKMAFKLHNANQIIQHELSEKKKAENALKRNQNQLLTIMENAPDTILHVDKSGKILYINKLSPGLTLDMVLGSSILNFVPDDEKDVVWASFEKAFKSGERQEYESSGPNHSEFQSNYNVRVMPVIVEGLSETAVYIATDTTSKKLAEAEVIRQLSEKELLLHEAHHRLKNNIQSIEAMLYMHAENTTSPEATSVIQDILGRIGSIRILYENLLLKKDFSGVSILDYMEKLIGSIMRLFPRYQEIKVSKNIHDFRLESKKTFSLGIIINELLTNIMKYAFLDTQKAEINIEIIKKEKTISLLIEDNGIGFPEGFDFKESTGFGLTLVNILCKQLGGNLKVESGLGAKITLQFIE